jgi:flavorubredoxin
MAYVLKMADYKRVQHKTVARFGSFGWSGGAQRDLESRLKKLKWELLDFFEFQGGPTAEDFIKGEEFGTKFAQHIKTQED